MIIVTMLSMLLGLPANDNCAMQDNTSLIIADTTIAPTESFFAAAQSFLSEYVVSGKVNYASIKSDPGELNDLYSMIGTTDLSTADNNTKTAFYLNAYNLIVIHSVLEKYPIASPLDVAGFFDKKKHVVAGQQMTLNELEEKKLRPDPRVHFALVCAAKGCPKLQSQAYLPATVQKQLVDATTRAVNDPQFLRVDYTNKTVQLSKIFEWYADDFNKTSGSVIQFINTYRSAKISDSYTLSYYEYDWSLNKL
ncbi:MAG TPA: DUF547 domain-containing protein [Chitinophagales bacterium]|nr:DUF547 domain-containing protein [Chitinophagales bacterium]HNM09246.1 DUF547 domain-containing protein [Chitinophagales bacterium]HNM29348.1 DUF547 domain-containing protein [Chitinophagales bacterium]